MKKFYLILTVLLLSVSLQAQNCPVNVAPQFEKLSSADSLFVSNVLKMENATCSTHCAIVLSSEIILTIKRSSYDLVLFLSRKEGFVTRYCEVYADGRFEDYGAESD